MPDTFDRENLIKKYRKKGFTESQIKILFAAREQGFDTTVLENPYFDEEQMKIILEGLSENVDVKKYAYPVIPAEVMKEIKEGLKEGIDLSHYIFTFLRRYSSYTDIEIVEILKELKTGFKNNIDLSAYAKPWFNANQLKQIRLGLEKGLDVSIYADPEFSAKQMETIRKGLEKGFNVLAYADSRFTEEQMGEIIRGLEKKVDVSKYAYPELNASTMELLRILLEEGIDYTRDPEWKEPSKENSQSFKLLLVRSLLNYLEKKSIISHKIRQFFITYIQTYIQNEPSMQTLWTAWIDLTSRLVKALHQGKTNTKNVKIAIESFTEKLINMYQKSQPHNIYEEADLLYEGAIRFNPEEFSYLANPQLSYPQMLTVFQGLKMGYNVSIYARPEFTPEQMREILTGLEERCDVSIYARPELTEWHMYAIRHALKHKLDISAHIKPEISAAKLYKKVIELLLKKTEKKGNYTDSEISEMVSKLPDTDDHRYTMYVRLKLVEKAISCNLNPVYFINKDLNREMIINLHDILYNDRQYTWNNPEFSRYFAVPVIASTKYYLYIIVDLCMKADKRGKTLEEYVNIYYKSRTSHSEKAQIIYELLENIHQYYKIQTLKEIQQKSSHKKSRFPSLRL